MVISRLRSIYTLPVGEAGEHRPQEIGEVADEACRCIRSHASLDACGPWLCCRDECVRVGSESFDRQVT